MALVLVLSISAGACTTSEAVDRSRSPVASPSTSPVPSVEARERLVALGEQWTTTGATVTYRTTAPVPGQPQTAHLCLRQLADRDQWDRTKIGEERTKLLRSCSRQGSLRLVWDPPDRWRMDVVTPVDRFTLLFTQERARICRGEDQRPCREIPTAEAVAMASADVFFRPSVHILDEIGATEVTAIGSPEDPVVPVECFAASGPDQHVEWCYAADGTLVSFLRGPSAKGWISFEATKVS